MNSQQKEVNLISICRKSGRLVLGHDAVKDAALEGNISIVLVTNDISLKTLKEVKFFCNNTKTDIVKMDVTMDDIFETLGKRVGVIGVADRGFANRFKELGTPIKATVPRSMKKQQEENK